MDDEILKMAKGLNIDGIARSTTTWWDGKSKAVERGEFFAVCYIDDMYALVVHLPNYPKLEPRGTMFKVGRILVEREAEFKEAI